MTSRTTEWDVAGFLEDIRELEQIKGTGTKPKRSTSQKKGRTMSFLDIAAAAQDAKPIEAVKGGEYKVEISYVNMNEENGWILFMLTIPDSISAKDISVILNLPGAGRTAKEENININRLLEFYRCFGLDPKRTYDTDASYPEGYLGATGWVILTDPKDDGKGYGMQNKVAKFLPRR